MYLRSSWDYQPLGRCGDTPYKVRSEASGARAWNVPGTAESTGIYRHRHTTRTSYFKGSCWPWTRESLGSSDLRHVDGNGAIFWQLGHSGGPTGCLRARDVISPDIDSLLYNF